jgi:hypothetical protein
MYYAIFIPAALLVGVVLGYAFRGRELRALKAALASYQGLRNDLDSTLRFFHIIK